MRLLLDNFGDNLLFESITILALKGSLTAIMHLYKHVQDVLTSIPKGTIVLKRLSCWPMSIMSSCPGVLLVII